MAMRNLMTVQEENRLRNQYMREAGEQGIGSPARRFRYATARLKGKTVEKAKEAAYFKTARKVY